VPTAAVQHHLVTGSRAWTAVNLSVGRQHGPLGTGNVVAPEVPEVLLAVPSAKEVDSLLGWRSRVKGTLPSRTHITAYLTRAFDDHLVASPATRLVRDAHLSDDSCRNLDGCVLDRYFH